MSTSQTPSSHPQLQHPAPAPGHDYHSRDLGDWFYPQTAPTDPFRTDLPRVSLLSALQIGNDPISVQRIPYRPPESKEEAPDLDTYLEGFTVPWYGDEWEQELEQRPEGQREIQMPEMVKPTRDPFDASGTGGSRRMRVRNGLNCRKRNHWDVRIWGYEVPIKFKANQPRMYFGEVINIIWRGPLSLAFLRILHSRLARSRDQ